MIAGSGNKTLEDKAKLAPFIVGGDDTSPADWPSHVMVHTVVGYITYFCGGVLISPRYVLSSAACASGQVNYYY